MFGGAPPDGDEVWCVAEDGKRHGQHIGWWPSGRKAFHRSYRDGRLHGPATEWGQDGSVLSVREYRDGIQQRRTSSVSAADSVFLTEHAPRSNVAK